MRAHNTDEEIAAAVAAYQAEGSQRNAASVLGIAQSTLNKRLKLAAQRGLLPTDPVMPGFRISQVTTNERGGKSIQQRPEHGDKWEMPDGLSLKGVTALVDGDGRLMHQHIMARKDNIATIDLVAALKSEFENYSGKAELIDPPAITDSNLLSVYPIADQHNGLLAWGRETGESYDLKIGAERLRASMGSLVAQSPRSQQAIILNLGDWQHTDDQRNQTPGHGNLLDVDSRYFKILTTGVRLMMDCIELALAKHSTVLVRNIPGNHDPHASVALTVALNAFYSNETRVTVDMDPSDFFFHRFGTVLLGATHGHKIRADHMAMMMANMRPSDWGETAYRYFYFGHIHHETVKETGGVRVESFQTLSAKDAWAHGKGYISGQSLTSITHHSERGEIGRHKVNILPATFARAAA